MLEPYQLNETDVQVIEFLDDVGGRVTPSWVAEETDNSRAYVSQRLKRLKEHGHVDQPHRGLWRLVDDPRPAADDGPADTADTDAAGTQYPGRNPWGSTVEDALAWAADNEPFTRAEVLDEFGGRTDIKPESFWKRHVRPALKEAGFESDRTGGRATWSRSEADDGG
jgi:DNA-binding transcriptional ArsR family regulator